MTDSGPDPPGLDQSSNSQCSNDQSSNNPPDRDEIERLLKTGLATDWADRADTHDKIQEIVGKLRASDGSLETKLRIAGFTLHPVEHGDIEQACESCMYYLVHRRYCELPELDLPAEPEWSCNLWRI